MVKRPDSTAYGGHAPHTASIATVLHRTGWNPPTGEPTGPTVDTLEALLYGVAGGAVFGTFFFHYEGHDPQVNLITRNTFHEYGWDAVCSRLGIAQDVIRSTSVEKAGTKLRDLVESGEAVVAWVDVFTLGHEHSELGDAMWSVQPVVVTGYDADLGVVRFADRSRRPHERPLEVFLEAWGRIKKTRFQMTVFDRPDDGRLPTAIRQGLANGWQLFFEKPPKGSASNFGHEGYTRLAADIRSVKGKTRWDRTLPTARDLMSGLMTAYKHGLLSWKDTSETADRAQFATFLDAAATILATPALGEVADEYRAIGALWTELGAMLLPEAIPVCGQARDTLRTRHRMFKDRGSDAIDELRELDARYGELLDEAAGLDRQVLAGAIGPVPDQLERIRDREAAALRRIAAIVDLGRP